MFSLNPYVLGAGAALALAVVGIIGFQSHQIHHYHSLFDKEHQNFLSEHGVIETLKAQQIQQRKITGAAVNKVEVVPGPTKTIIKEIHDAPLPANCGTPRLSDDDLNAF